LELFFFFFFFFLQASHLTPHKNGGLKGMGAGKVAVGRGSSSRGSSVTTFWHMVKLALALRVRT